MTPPRCLLCRQHRPVRYRATYYPDSGRAPIQTFVICQICGATMRRETVVALVEKILPPGGRVEVVEERSS